MSRPKLNEVMGSVGEKAKGEGLSLKDLPDILGEKLPELPHSPVGRFRLITALRNRFGTGFRNIPGVQQILQDFDSETQHKDKLAQMRAIKPRGARHG